MSFLELAWKRNSVRNFKTDDIPVEKIVKLLDAARSAPSAGNCQPWYFYVIKDTVLKKQICNFSYNQHWMLNAPVFIIVCADIARTEKKYSSRGRDLYCIQDTAAAIQNLLLCATDEGLAACWCGAFDEKAVSNILELNNNFRPVAIIPIGYAVNEPAKTSRRPVEEISKFIGFENETIPKNEPQRIKFEHGDININGALFNDMNLSSSEFININMESCTFKDVNLSNVKITECNLANMSISNCNLNGFSINGKDISGLLIEKQ